MKKTYKCPRCRAKVKVDDAETDGEQKCPKCGYKMAVVEEPPPFDAPELPAANRDNPMDIEVVGKGCAAMFVAGVIVLVCLGIIAFAFSDIGGGYGKSTASQIYSALRDIRGVLTILVIVVIVLGCWIITLLSRMLKEKGNDNSS